MREQEMVTGAWMRMDTMKCVQEVKGGVLLYVFRFIVQDG